MPNVFDSEGGIIADARPVTTDEFDQLRERVVIAADAMAVAMASFTGVLVAAEVLAKERDTARIDCEHEEGANLLDQLPEITSELESCMQECMMGDLECVSACIEQAKLAAG